MRYVTALMVFLAFIVVTLLVWAVFARPQFASFEPVEPQACIAG